MPGAAAAARRPRPLALADLPNAAELGGLAPEEKIKALHEAAVAAGHERYIDPASGYSVMTAATLARRTCCGNICRHCPYGYKKGAGPAAAGAAALGAPAPPEW